ncbi:MAG: hypothetical protein RBT59_05755 [Arcobacteraceae bacterium]|jgi:hypothetical protein|nr:hypothetical protein [Arcobacteraceae bacterium]
MRQLLEESQQLPNFEKLETVFLDCSQHVIKAYQKILSNFPITYNHEDILNDALYEALDEVFMEEADNGGHYLMLIPQAYDPTKRKQYGKAAKPDFIILWNTNPNYRKYAFFFECKRLSCNHKNQEYINNGINRYKKSFYAKEMPFAAMIGYIEQGNVEQIITDINEKLSTKFPNDNKIVHNNLFYWKSSHSRKDNDNITLYHIFLDFRDTQKKITLCANQQLQISRINENMPVPQ